MTTVDQLHNDQLRDLRADFYAAEDYRTATGDQEGPTDLGEGLSVALSEAAGYDPDEAEDGSYLGTMVRDDGYSFTVWKGSNPDLPTHCRYCGDKLLTESERWACEFDQASRESPVRYRDQPNGLPFVFVDYTGGRHGIILREVIPFAKAVPGSNPASHDCQCNGCRQRRMGERKAGGQPIQCGKPECAQGLKADTARRNRKARADHDAWTAYHALRNGAQGTDKEIGAAIGVRPIRVKEARSRLFGPKVR